MLKERKEAAKWWFWILGLIVFSVPVFLGLQYVGVFGERVIFENSHQYHEARKSEIAAYEAQLAEIQSRLRAPELDRSTRNVLEAQASAIRIQLNTARSK